MERSEPSLVPEWLKIGGSVSSSLRSDDRTVSRPSRNKSYVNGHNHNLGRTSVFDRTTPYFGRSSSSNGSHGTRSYSNFSGNIRDRGLNKDIHYYGGRDRSVVGEHSHLDDFDAMEHNCLKRSQSMVSCKREVTWPRKASSDLRSANKKNYNNGNGIIGGGSLSNGVNKTVLDRHFPSLGAEESQMASDIGRLPSPGLTTAIQSLLVGGDKWTSVLAEVPVIGGSQGTHDLCTQQAVLASSPPVASNTPTFLNMAEALAQGPAHAQDSPQLSIETQRLEELAIKQSKQLIPVIPLTSKSLVSNASDKLKSKFLQQQNQNSSPRLPMKVDVLKSSSAGKLHVLKSVRERNATFPATKYSMSPSSSKAVTSPIASSSSLVGSTSKSQGSTPALSNAERKSAFVVLEKRPVSQSQSRSDFFNLMRKKSMTNSSSAISETGPTTSPPVLNKLGEAEAAAVALVLDSDVSLSDISSEDGAADNRGGSFNDNGDADVESPKSLYSATNPHSEEEETAFLRSLGWDENGGDDGGLTEEEINAFYRDARKYINSRPMQKLWSKGLLTEEEKGNNR